MTLVEVMVATVLGAIVATAAIQLGASLRISANSVSTSASAVGSLHITNRRLEMLLYAALPPTDSFPFIGNDHSVHLRVAPNSALPAGQLLSVVRRSGDVVLLIAGVDAGYLRRAVDAFTIDYLAARGLTSTWLPVWVSRTTLPAAIRFRLRDSKTFETDTLLMSPGVHL